MEAMTGKTLGQYQIIEQIGQGGMAAVYKGYQPSLNRNVAIKILPSYYAHDPGFAARFIREAQAIAHLEHPNILPIYDFGKQEDISYIVMKYVAAGTLQDKLGHAMSPAEATKIIKQIAGALDTAHEQGILHRDVKPGNILIDKRGWIYLSDFGLAKMVEGSVQLTGTGVGVGTPAYMSPEQAQGQTVDARTDVYAVGVILFEMLTGRVPYQADTPLAVVIKHVTDPLPIPRHINPNIPEPVEQVLLKSLAKNPNHRFDSVGALHEALEKVVQELDPGIAIAPIPSGPEIEPEESESTLLYHTPPPPSTPSAPPMRPASSIPPSPPPQSLPASPYPASATPDTQRNFPLVPIIIGIAGLALGGLALLGGLAYLFSTDTATPTVVSAKATPSPTSPLPIVVSEQTPTPTLSPASSPTSPPKNTNTPTIAPVDTEMDTLAISPTNTPVPATNTPTPVPTNTPPPSPTPVTSQWTDTGLRPNGRFADIWIATEAEQGKLGYPIAELETDRLCARENFERGYMLWFDRPGDSDLVWSAVIPYPGAGEGNNSYKFTDIWPGSPEYWCSEAEAKAPLGPKRGFGMLWCMYPDLRTDIGNAVDEEQGGPDNPRCEGQLFQGGAIVHNPLDATYWTFFNNGGWIRFGQ